MPDNERIRVGDRVTIFRRGKNRTWTADFSHEGRHKRESLKTSRKKVALQRATELGVRLLEGKFASAPASIREALESYLDFLKTEGRARKTLVRYRGELQTLTAFCESHRVTSLSQITPVLFDRFRAGRRNSYHPKMFYHEGMVAKQFLKWCVSRRLISGNPLQDYKLHKPPFESRSVPSIAEIARILHACSPRMQCMIATLAMTGMRSGELRQLRHKDVDLKEGWIRIVSRDDTPTKTRTSRDVPIHPLLKSHLQQGLQPGQPWYFTAEPSRKYPEGGHWISTQHLSERFTRIVARLELPHGRAANGDTIHSLRHFFETFCVNSGIPQRVIDTWMGHRSDRSMAAVYYRLGDKESQEFMQRVPFSFPTL